MLVGLRNISCLLFTLNLEAGPEGGGLRDPRGKCGGAWRGRWSGRRRTVARKEKKKGAGKGGEGTKDMKVNRRGLRRGKERDSARVVGSPTLVPYADLF